MKKLIGRFYLKLTDSKNLIGEFSHNLRGRVYTEGAFRKPCSDGEQVRNPEDTEYVGIYFSTWYDEDEDAKCVFSELEIVKKHQNIFSLEWHLVDNNGQRSRQIFWGEGMLSDGKLVGDYRNFKNP